MNYELLEEMLDYYKHDTFSQFVAENYATLNDAERVAWHRLRCGESIDLIRTTQLGLF